MPGNERSCPCGSGKSYEKCCGKNNVLFSLDQVRWRRAGQDLRRRLGEFADQPSFTWDAARAQDLYLGCLDAQLADRDDDFTMERCFEWFIFDYKLSSGRTVIETFRDDNSHILSSREASLVRDWARTRISLYEVTGVIPDEGLYIKDLIGQREFKVRDINAAAEIVTGNILLMRVLKVGEEYEFSTSGLALPGHYKEPLLERIHRDRQDYFTGKKAGARGWIVYLQERAHRINAWVMELGLSGARGEKEPAGRSLPECRVILSVENWQEALNSLRRSDTCRMIRELKDCSGVFRQATAAILGRHRRLDGPAQPPMVPAEASDECAVKTGEAVLSPVIGHLVLTQQFIIITAGLPKLLSKCKKTLMELFKGAVAESPAGRQRRPYTSDGAALTEDRQKIAGGEGDNYPWPEPEHAAVASWVKAGLDALGYNPKQQKGALKLWYDYCSKEKPSVRKAAVWAATVIYTFTRVEMENGLKQQDLAGRYGVASSTISARFRQLCRALELVAYDKRYSTKKPPSAGLWEYHPLFRGLPES